MRKPRLGGGWPALWYTLKKGREAGGLLKLYRALRARNACKTCALGMGGQQGGMVNERGHRFEVCKKSIQAMVADMNGAIRREFFNDFDIAKLRAFSPRELESAGRIAEPMYRGPLDSGYRPIGWDEALAKVASKLQRTAPDESFFYFSGRSSNEAGFLLQLFARLYGTNNVNNCSYYCHQASGVALSSITGSGTATITLEDIDGADLLFVVGANPASNHPRFMKSVVELRRRGGKVIVVNPLREVGLERFKVPSDWRSMIFGSRTCDDYVQPHIGGDVAFILALSRAVVEAGAVDEAFVKEHCEGWPELASHLRALDPAVLSRESGVSAEQIAAVAQAYARSRRTIFAWAMGLTHHEHGVRNVQALGTLALLRGMAGRAGCGLLPLRGHSNVQGIGSMGVTPQLKDAVFARLQSHFGVSLPTSPGLDTLRCMERARAGGVRLALCLGGNLYGSNPDANFAAEALNTIDMVVYLSTTLNTGHAWGTGRETLILPVRARDEEAQSTTQESMFNFVRLSEGGPPRVPGVRSEVEVIAGIAESYFSGRSPVDWKGLREHREIRRAIAQIIPGYEEIGRIDESKREFHVGGRILREPKFPTPSGRARLHLVERPAPFATGANELRLMTIRSEGQFNTVVYEEEDFYRGQDRRDVILMNERDIARLGLRTEERVTVRSATGALKNVIVRPFDIREGNAAMYYPEANVLVPRSADRDSGTPRFKSVAVKIEAE